MATETDLIRAKQVEVVIVVICRGRACGAVCHIGWAVLAHGLLHSWEAEEVQTAGRRNPCLLGGVGGEKNAETERLRRTGGAAKERQTEDGRTLYQQRTGGEVSELSAN
ncbi:hypothetical protein CRUP_022223 [Coryphaenoides rupestris]|nr:hypothetical protein CRUP_022223 [Coryphaenoides rupestris]